MRLIFKCSNCLNELIHIKKHTGLKYIKLPRKCPHCAREFNDVETVNVVEPKKIVRDLDPPLHSNINITTSGGDYSSSIDDGIDDTGYSDHAYPITGDRLEMRFNVPESSKPFMADVVSRMAHKGRYSKLSATQEKVLTDRILILSRILSVMKRAVFDTTFNIVNDIIRKMEQRGVGELDKLVAVTLYLVAHSYGVSADKETVIDIVGSKSKFKELAMLVLPHLRFNKTTLITITVSELASALNMDERLYVKTLRLALQLRYLNTTPQQIACLAVYLMYNAYALVTGREAVSQSEIGVKYRTTSLVRTVEILLS